MDYGMKKERDSLYAKLRKITAGIALGIGLLGLTGCATTGYTGESKEYKRWEVERLTEARKKQNGNMFKDSYLGRRLFSENEDLYIENLDGTDKKRITYSPETKETWAFFTKDGKYVFYRTTDNNFSTEEYNIALIEEGKAARRISEDEYSVYWEERFK